MTQRIFRTGRTRLLRGRVMNLAYLAVCTVILVNAMIVTSDPIAG
jgi:hypothetical protein